MVVAARPMFDLVTRTGFETKGGSECFTTCDPEGGEGEGKKPKKKNKGFAEKHSIFSGNLNSRGWGVSRQPSSVFSPSKASDQIWGGGTQRVRGQVSTEGVAEKKGRTGC